MSIVSWAVVMNHMTFSPEIFYFIIINILGLFSETESLSAALAVLHASL